MTKINSAPELRVSALALMAIISERPMTGYEIKKLIELFVTTKRFNKRLQK